MKNLFLVFRGEMMCFSHVLLYAKEIKEKDGVVAIIVEGEATALMPELFLPDRPFSQLFKEVYDAGLVDSVCRACSAKMGVLERVEACGLPLRGELSGHPSITAFLEKGYQLTAF